MSEHHRCRFLFIINPISGGKTKADWETAIRNQFLPRGIHIEIYILNGSTDEASIRHWIEFTRPENVIAVGGDGTVSMVAKQLLGTGIPLGIMPAGSANGMATELGIPDDIEGSIDVLTSGVAKRADVIRINDKHICLHLSDIGLNAQLIKHFEEGRIRGKLGYATKVLKTLWHRESMDIHVKMHDQEDRITAWMVVLANATKYGTGAVINPDGSLYDGVFELVIMKRLAISEILKMFFRPRPFNPEKIKIYPASAVTIKTRKGVHFQVDGEYLGKVTQVEAHILAGQLTIIVPAEKPSNT